MTHISHAALAEMELGWQEQGEEGAKGRELLLSAMRVTLEPGDNRVVLQGKVGVAREGEGLKRECYEVLQGKVGVAREGEGLKGREYYGRRRWAW